LEIIAGVFNAKARRRKAKLKGALAARLRVSGFGTRGPAACAPTDFFVSLRLCVFALKI
jgi:hypothetical protein